jgi:hypothetical protein
MQFSLLKTKQEQILLTRVSIVCECDVGLFVVEEEDERLKRARVRDTVLQINWRLEKSAAAQTVPLLGTCVAQSTIKIL